MYNENKAALNIKKSMMSTHQENFSKITKIVA